MIQWLSKLPRFAKERHEILELAKTRKISNEELGKHNVRDDCWISLTNKSGKLLCYVSFFCFLKQLRATFIYQQFFI